MLAELRYSFISAVSGHESLLETIIRFAKEGQACKNLIFEQSSLA